MPGNRMIKGQPHSLAYMTGQEMEAMNELRREPGLRGRLARKGARKKFDFVDGIPAFFFGDWGGSSEDEEMGDDSTDGPSESERIAEQRSQDAWQEAQRATLEGGNYQSNDPFYQSTFGNRGSGGGGSGGFQPPQKTPEQIEAERREAKKKEWDARNKADDEKFRREETIRQRERFTQGQMKDAEGRTMSDRGEFVDSEGRKQGEEGFDFETAERQGGYDASTGKMDTEGSFEGYRQDYKGLRDRADFSGYRDDMGGYQDAADKLRGEAATKYAGYESQISKMPDYGSQVAGMAGQMRGAGNRMERIGSGAQSQLQGLNPQIQNQVGAGQQGIGAASRQVGGAMGDLSRASQAVGSAALRGEGRGLGAANQLGNLAGQATDTQALMKDRGLFAGQLESARKTSEEGNLANIRRSMAASGASPQEIARAEAEARKGGARAGREDALRASQMAMQSGQSQLAQAGQLYGQQGMMGMQAAGMGMQGAQSQAGMAGQRAAMAGQQAGMAQSSANLGLAGLGQQAGNIQAGAGLGMQGAQGNLAAMGAATGALSQAQNLGLGKIGAQAGMYGQGLQAQQGMMGMGANLAQNQQSSLQSELATKGALTGQMAGMTEAQMQDVVAQQNQAFEKEMAEKGYAYQRDAAAANRPRSPSTMQQLGGLIQTVAPIAMAAWSDRGLKKNIRSAKDEDLLKPEEIDGFLSHLYAKQYNYKDGKHGKGKQVGVMAQDLEKTQLGKQMVEDTPEGKRVDYGKGLGLVVASQARLNERLNAIGA